VAAIYLLFPLLSAQVMDWRLGVLTAGVPLGISVGLASRAEQRDLPVLGLTAAVTLGLVLAVAGMPLVRAAATTAVVAGTAGAVRHHQEQKYANQAAEQQAQQQAVYEQAVPEPAPAAPAPAGIDMEQLKQLGELHTAGVLSDEEFAAAKAKLLGT
jgi:hypothetical protein